MESTRKIHNENVKDINDIDEIIDDSLFQKTENDDKNSNNKNKLSDDEDEELMFKTENKEKQKTNNDNLDNSLNSVEHDDTLDNYLQSQTNENNHQPISKNQTNINFHVQKKSLVLNKEISSIDKDINKLKNKLRKMIIENKTK